MKKFLRLLLYILGTYVWVNFTLTMPWKMFILCVPAGLVCVTIWVAFMLVLWDIIFA